MVVVEPEDSEDVGSEGRDEKWREAETSCRHISIAEGFLGGMVFVALFWVFV